MILLNNFDIAPVETAFIQHSKTEKEKYTSDIKKLCLEKACCLISIDVKLKQDDCIAYEHHPGSGAEHILLLTPDRQHCRIIHVASNKEHRFEPQGPWFVYLSESEKTAFFYKNVHHARFIMVIFSQSWFNGQARSAGETSGDEFIFKKLAKHSFGRLSSVQAELVVQLQQNFDEQKPILLFKSGLFRLFGLFAAYENNLQKRLGGPADMMQEVREKLLSYLRAQLPPTEELAREFHTSASTLKRHFKAAYGQSIYDYYLNCKMELAMKLIAEQRLNVGQAAEELGYESVSHFCAIFKKRFGYHPGDFKKQS